MRKNNCDGFSLVEMLIATTLTLVIGIVIVMLLITSQRSSLTESMKQEMNQGGRALQQVLGDSFKSSGSVLNILDIPSLLGSRPIFNGIYPFNNINYADGVILAAGDPEVVTRTTFDFNSAGPQLKVQTTKLLGSLVVDAWAKDDIGILVRPLDGCYYVFRVDAVTDEGTLAINTQPVYYSGLIQSAKTYNHYNDACALGTGAYTANSLVIRLDYFYIFLARDEANGTRSLTLTTDTQGDSNFLNDSNLAIPIIPNIEDIQFSYVLKKDGTDVNPADNNDFLDKRVSAVRVFVLYKTEEQKFKGVSTMGIVYNKPKMGDRPATTLPAGLFNYNFNEYQIYLRNGNTLY